MIRVLLLVSLVFLPHLNLFIGGEQIHQFFNSIEPYHVNKLSSLAWLRHTQLKIWVWTESKMAPYTTTLTVCPSTKVTLREPQITSPSIISWQLTPSETDVKEVQRPCQIFHTGGWEDDNRLWVKRVGRLCLDVLSDNRFPSHHVGIRKFGVVRSSSIRN